MSRFSVVRHCPLCVQFWLYGLDAKQGDLTLLGYQKQPAEYGSSVYATPQLQLHSAGLKAQVPEGEVDFQRRTGRFTLNGSRISPQRGRSLIWPLLREHESRLCELHGAQWREQQLATHKLPPPIRRNVGLWREYIRPVYGSWETPARPTLSN